MGRFQKGISIDYSCCDKKVIDLIDNALNKKQIVSAETYEIIDNHDGVFCNEQMDSAEALKVNTMQKTKQFNCPSELKGQLKIGDFSGQN